MAHVSGFRVIFFERRFVLRCHCGDVALSARPGASSFRIRLKWATLEKKRAKPEINAIKASERRSLRNRRVNGPAAAAVT